MSAVLTAAALFLALGDLALVVASWKSRTVLAGVLGATGLPLVAVALVHGATRGASEYSIVIAGVTLAIGALLCLIGRALERALEDPDENCPSSSC